MTMLPLASAASQATRTHDAVHAARIWGSLRSSSEAFFARSGSVLSSYAKPPCLVTRYRDPDNARCSWWRMLAKTRHADCPRQAAATHRSSARCAERPEEPHAVGGKHSPLTREPIAVQ